MPNLKFVLTPFVVSSLPVVFCVRPPHRICLTALVLFWRRLLKSGKVMPAGILTAAGAVGLVYHFTKMKEWAP